MQVMDQESTKVKNHLHHQQQVVQLRLDCSIIDVVLLHQNLREEHWVVSVDIEVDRMHQDELE
jgi:hypothetical protein